MPIWAEILDVQISNQDGKYVLWALINPEIKETEQRKFIIYGTGHTITGREKLKYLKTLQDGYFVWHVFEEINQ